MKKRIMIDPKLLNNYMKFVAKGDVTPSINSFLAYQEATQKAILEVKKSRIKLSEDKTVYRINVNERLDFNHTYIVELPKNIDDEKVWSEVDNCTGTGKTSDINLIVAKFGGNILNIDVDITPGVDIEIDEVEVISNEK